MKKTAWILTLAIFSALFTGPYALSAEKPPRLITVSGDAEIRVVPDEVVITLGVETSNKVLSLAQKANDAVVRAVIEKARKNRIDQKHIQTDYFTVEPRYDTRYDSREERNRDLFVGYFVRKNMSITLKDLSRYEDVISGVLESGANYVHGISFRTTELRKHRDAARVMAVKAAREKAELYARELGVKIRGAVTLNEEYGGWWSWSNSPWGGPLGRANMMQNVSQNAMGSGGGQPTEGGDTLAPGQISVTARVSAVFEMD